MRKGFFPRLALSGMRKNRSIYYPYILTAVLTTAMMYIMGSLQQITTDYSGTLAFSLQLGIVVTSVFSVIFLFYTNSFLMRRRKKEFGLYNILGMEKRHLARLLLWETALMLLLSLVLGLAVGVLLDKLMHLLLSHLVGQAVSLTFALSPGSMLYTAVLVSLTFVLIWVNSVRQVYFARPVELLRSAEVGEREPKARWFIALLGLIALGTGYWLSATVKDAGDTLRLLDETFTIKKRISDDLGAGQALASIYDYYCLVVDGMDTLSRLDRQQQALYGDLSSSVSTTMSFTLVPASEELSREVGTLLRGRAEADGFTSVAERSELHDNLLALYGGLLFVGLFLGLLFTMAMILIIYYKQITEGYEDRERYRIMRKVGLSRREIRRSISSQILIVFFLPLAAAGLHVTFAFPGIVTMFRALSMTNVTLIAGCALGSFAGFAVLYGAVYLLTARVYYRIVSE